MLAEGHARPSISKIEIRENSELIHRELFVSMSSRVTKHANASIGSILDRKSIIHFKIGKGKRFE
jgi:hypothetical protein